MKSIFKQKIKTKRKMNKEINGKQGTNRTKGWYFG